MGLERSIDAAIDAVYAAALDEAAWPAALTALSRCLGSVGAVAFAMENATTLVTGWSGFGIEAGMRDYGLHYAKIDPRTRYVAAHPELSIHYDYLLIDERGMDRSEFYTWQSRTTDDFRYFIGCRVRVDPAHTGFLALHWPRRRGHVQPAQIRVFERLVPHIERAFQVARQVGGAKLYAEASVAILDRLPQGVVLLDRNGCIIAMNRAAAAIARDGDGLAVVDRRLAARRSSDAAILQRMLGRAVAQPPGSGGVHALARPSGRRPYALLVSPLPAESSLFAAQQPAAVVFISDPERVQEVPADTLVRLYGLTRTEAALAERLATGMTIERAAAAMDIALATARLHLQHVLKKTGTHRQSELIGLLLRGMPDVLPGGGRW